MRKNNIITVNPPYEYLNSIYAEIMKDKEFCNQFLKNLETGKKDFNGEWPSNDVSNKNHIAFMSREGSGKSLILSLKNIIEFKNEKSESSFIPFSLYLSRLEKNSKINPSNLEHFKTSLLSYVSVYNKNLDNKEMVKVIANNLKPILNINHQYYYDLMSKLIGQKNYNIVSGNRLNFKDYFTNKEEFLKDIRKYPINKFKTGLNVFDSNTEGGIPRGAITSVLGKTNLSRVLMSQSLACQILKNNEDAKVLHIDLEGLLKKTYSSYYANLTGKSYEKTLHKNLSKDESKLEREINKRYKERLKIKRYLPESGRMTIEGLTDYCNEIYNEFKFNVLVINYGQLLNTDRKVETLREITALAFRGLDSIAKSFNCALITPVSITRSAQIKNGVITSEDGADSFETARISELILSINFTADDYENNQGVLYIDKCRDGNFRNKTYVIKTNFQSSNLMVID